MKSLPSMPTMRALLLATASLLGAVLAAAPPVELQAPVAGAFRFAAYGDTRFTDPGNTGAADPRIRQLLVQAIADARPAFITIGGDIAYNGQETGDWARYDLETAVWRERGIPVFPVLGNHDLHGPLATALGNYFQRFPQLAENRFYSVRAGNLLILILDSAQDELAGPQGDWLRARLDGVAPGTEFVAVMLHHPPYTSAGDGGHTARAREQALARFLEGRQKTLPARLVVFGSHVHNYERQEHGGITYLTTGGGGAHPHPIERQPGDLFVGGGQNFHFLAVDMAPRKMTVTMNRVEVVDGAPRWTRPDQFVLTPPQL